MFATDDIAYVKGRLFDTIITHMNKAVLVTGVRTLKKSIQVSAIEVLSEKEIADDISNYDLTPVKLGFVNNYELTQSVYVSRKPLRNDWRQGFRLPQCSIIHNYKYMPLITNKDVAKTVEGLFPTLDELNPVNGMLAWCRTFALNSNEEIIYRGFGKVGKFLNRKDREFKLEDEFFWVEDRLKKVL